MPELSGTELLTKAMDDLKNDETGSETPDADVTTESGNETASDQESNIDPITGASKEPDANTDADIKPDKTKAPPDDPEFDVDLGGGKTEKIKLSLLKKGYMQQGDYTKKSQDLARQREEVEPLLNFVNLAKQDQKAVSALVSFVEQFIKDDKINPEFIERFNSFVSGKQETPQAIDFKDPELNRALTDIDPESDLGKVIMHVLQKNNSLEKELREFRDGYTKKEQAQAEAANKQEFQKMVDGARAFYTDTVKTLGDDQKKFKFHSPEERQDWESEVRKRVSNDNTEFANETFTSEFKACIEKHAAEAYAYINRIGERRVAAHLKTNTTKLPVSGGNVGGDRPPTGEYQKGLSLNENIENMLRKRKEDNEKG
jgi:hypothetical protein